MFNPTQARIRLDSIRTNLENVRAWLGPGPRLLLSVKADGYGHGAVAVAAMAERTGLADWFGVATVPEGRSLRLGGIRLPILKFSPAFPEEMAAAVEAGLTLNVCDHANVQALQEVCARLGTGARVHLEVETGMGRSGVVPEAAPELARFIEAQCPDLFLEGVFTHFPVGDMASGTAFTRGQMVLFRQTLERIARALGRMPELLHAANSGAVLAHPESWLSLVRTGTLAYGYYPVDGPDRPIPLEPSLSLVTRIIQLRRLPRGAGVDPEAVWTAPADTWVATLPLGTADGLDHRLAHRGRALVRGRSCPIVGRIHGGHTLIDLGPDTPARTGDEVVLVGRSGDQEITLYEVAEHLGTIPCAFTTGLGPRVARAYPV